jgi:hypothetical protein
VFFFLKWTVILSIVIFVFYVGNVFFNLPEDESAKIKNTWQVTMDSQDNKELVTTILEPIKKDWLKKKALMIKKVREKLNLNNSHED